MRTYRLFGTYYSHLYLRTHTYLQGKWKRDEDDGCANDYVLLFRDKLRGFRTMGFIGKTLKISRRNQVVINMEDELTLRVIHERVFQGDIKAKVSLYMLCHVRVQDSTGMLPFTLIGSKRKLYQCKEVHVKQSSQPRMAVEHVIDFDTHKVTLLGSTLTHGSRASLQELKLRVSGRKKKWYRRKSKSMIWTIVLQTRDSLGEVLRYIKKHAAET